VARSAAWDAEIDRQAREKILTAQIEGRERHARLGQALLSVMTLPVKAALEASRDGKMIQQLIASAQHDAQGAYQLLAAVARMAQVASGVVTMERQALGLSSVETPVAHEDSREFDLAFANRVIADPEATDMAIALLHRVAGGTGAPPAERLGAPRQPGEVADGSPSQPADEEAGGLGAAPDHAPLGGTAA
jgi:hypothetical protein